jgi:hypothetical protein
MALRLMRYVSLAAVAAAILALPAQAAGPWYVDPAGNDANSCQGPGALGACRTIQAAINKASAGDTINVAAGMYPEGPGPLSINKRLTLLGAQAGIDARTRSELESTISDSQGTSVSASGVVIDGFTIQNSVVSAFTGYGIWLNPGVSGTQIVNDIFQNNIVGLGLANRGAEALIQHSVFRDNNQAGGASGSGIYTDVDVGGALVENVRINENSFTGNDNAGIDISNTAFGVGGVNNVEVTHNSFDSDGRSVLLFNTHGLTFDHNRVTNSMLAGSAAVRIFDGNTDLRVTYNDLIGGPYDGIRSSTLFDTPSSRISINQNNIEQFLHDGLNVVMSSTTETVDATCNWWESSSGPQNASNPGGTGEPVEGDADFTPWLTARAPNGLCHGGVPSTPGKVTGGGQISGDPLFSALGALLTPPAIIASAAGPQAQATFGFVVQCCAPRGNLEYDDHMMDVSIKATSIDFLAISPGSSCTPAGGQHAEFSGSATVKRATVTTNESFTVDVDDCGEPGATDKFSISTSDGYSNGGTLIGGNIQIH